jgi:hypothetical protein
MIFGHVIAQPTATTYEVESVHALVHYFIEPIHTASCSTFPRSALMFYRADSRCKLFHLSAIGSNPRILYNRAKQEKGQSSLRFLPFNLISYD